MRKKELFIRKPIHAIEEPDTDKGDQPELKRHLNSLHLIAIGIGAIIGAGIFVITGQAAAQFAGPAVVVSFIIAAIICVFSGLCYSELSALIPVSGGSYSYSYVAMGEFPAWIVGWSILAQVMFSSSTIAIGWSGYLNSLLNDFNIHLPAAFTMVPFSYSSENGLFLNGNIINIPAMLLIVALTGLISMGIRAAAYFNNAMVVIKLSVIVLIIVLGIPHINSENWVPFVPPNTGHFGDFGVSGILRGAGLIFFAYIGFDFLATLAQETINPQRSIPIGILGSLTISTIAYVLTALVLTGVASYTLLNIPDPMSLAINAIGPNLFWLGFTVKLAILAGLASVVMVSVLGLARIFFAISKDGLLPKSLSRLHPKSRSPLIATLLAGLFPTIIAGFFPIAILGQLTSMVTLFLFSIVCFGVLILRYRHPEIHRPFRVPLVPFIPLLAIACCIFQMFCMPVITWLQFAGWTMLGLGVYFFYSINHSRLQKAAAQRELEDTLY